MFYIYIHIYIAHIYVQHIYYIGCPKRSRIYELNIKVTITNREGIWIVVFVSAYIVRQNIMRWRMTIIHVLRLNYGHPYGIRSLTFLEEILQKKVVRFQRSYLLIFSLTLGGVCRVRSRSYLCFNETCFLL